jgi:PAS domain S-box-containing protein
LLLAAVGLVASFWGLGPSLVAVFESALLFNYLLTVPYGAWSLSPAHLIRTSVFVSVGVLIALLSKQRKSTEEKLRVAMAFLQDQQEALMQAQRAAKAAAWIFTTTDRKTRWFPGGPEIFGRSFEEITAMGSPTQLLPEEDRLRVAQAAELTARTGADFHVQFRVRWPDGETHWLETNGSPLPSDPTIWRGVTIDITERKRAESALIRAEKLAAAGRLASTIAHEINNPLEAITNLLYLVEVGLDSNSPARLHLEMAEKEIARLAGISRLTLNFVRKPPVGPIHLASVIDSVLDLFEARCTNRGIVLQRVHCAEAIVALPGDQLRQVFANLISNAFDAVTASHSPRKEIAVQSQAESGLVRIAVSDTGIGIAPEVLGQIFDPFFSTKDDIGTGIGLWVTKELIEKYDGEITVESGDHLAPYQTTFHIQLPSIHAEALTPGQKSQTQTLAE